MSYHTMTSVADAISSLPTPYPPVSLIKYHKGTSITQPGSILAIDPSSATIQATQCQTFYILSGMVHLRSKAFTGAITATIHPVDYSRGTFRLSDLSYAGWQERRAERVQPKYPTYVEMQHYRKTYHAFLQDISDEGMGILVNEALYPAGRLQPGHRLRLEFQLTAEQAFVSLKAVIVYRVSAGPPLIKYGLQLLPNPIQRNKLQGYVSQRYDEILYELEQEYIRLSDPFRVENQCF
jgi:hypothetical protein